MPIGHGGIIEVKVLAHLGNEIDLFVDAVEAQRSHGRQSKRHVSNIVICLFINFKTPVAILRPKYFVVHFVKGQHQPVREMLPRSSRM